jgi:hypothetical protein
MIKQNPIVNIENQHSINIQSNDRPLSISPEINLPSQKDFAIKKSNERKLSNSRTENSNDEANHSFNEDNPIF